MEKIHGDSCHSETFGDSETFFTFIANLVQESKVPASKISWPPNQNDTQDLGFLCGFVGYLGYEMKSESMGHNFKTISANPIPDASFLFADRLVIFDHETQAIYLSVASNAHCRNAQLKWVHDTERFILNLKGINDVAFTKTKVHLKKPQMMKLAHPKIHYLSNVCKSLEKIKIGETYEVCLTTQLSASEPALGRKDFYEMYRHLRKSNAAPYGAFLSFPGITIASSSPERYFQLENSGWITMKPIKGTLPRATILNFQGNEEELAKENEKRIHALQTNAKDLAENLMIVDLIRNDLTLISDPDSVHVPSLMKVESYATVHQLVSTVKGKLRKGFSAVDAAMRCFPPGSMTGSPKLRTLNILEDLEKEPRGVYSGTLGFFSLNGTSSFSVVIRSAVFCKDKVSVGAGGAIVCLSDPEMEFDEMVLKANSVLPSLKATMNLDFQPI